MSLPLVLLAGGLATRLKPLTEKLPKSLIQVAGQPFIAHQLDLMQQQGITDVVVCVGYLGDLIEQAVGDGQDWDIKVRYISDGPTLLGTGGAVRRAAALLGNAFFVMYGDSYLQCDFRQVEEAFHISHQPGLMTVFRNEGAWDTSNVVFAKGQIVRYDKRKRTSDMHYIDYGLGVLEARVLLSYPDNEPFDLMIVYQDLLARGQLAGLEVNQRFYEIGSPAGLAETCQYLAHKEIDDALRSTTSRRS